MTTSHPGARRGVLYALIPPVLWLGAMTTYSLIGPVPTDFRSHLLTGLAVFAAIILGPLLLVLLTLNWIIRRVAGVIIALLFIGMVRGGLSQGFGLVADMGIVLVSGALVGSMLFLLPRAAVRRGVGDDYSFIKLGDVLTYSFRRKPLAP